MPDPLRPDPLLPDPPLPPGTTVMVAGSPFTFAVDDRGLWQLSNDSAVISWNPDPASGTIDNIEVAVALRRQGLATALWHAARQLSPHLRHDRDDELTVDGGAWARSVGGPNAPVPGQR